MALLPPPRPTGAPGWFRVARVLAWIWLGLCLLLSWGSAIGVSCSGDPCQSRADTGWAVLMGLQLVLIVAAAVLLTRRSSLRYWGLAVAALLPPITLVVVTKAFYPPAFRF